MIKLQAVFIVALGGACGAILRYGLSLLTRSWSDWLPWGTLLSNAGGCLLLGIVTALALEWSILPGPWFLFLATGLCGGFTTMSTFIFELVGALKEGQFGFVFVYAVGGFVLNLFFFMAGHKFVQIWFSRGFECSR